MRADELFKIGKSTNLLLAGARGMIGGRFVLRQLNGVTVISRRPKKPTSQTEDQRHNRQRFRLATEFAKKELMSPDRKAHYSQLAVRAGLPNAYTAAVRDYMRKGHVMLQKTAPKLRPKTLLEPRRTRTSTPIRPDRSPAKSPWSRFYRLKVRASAQAARRTPAGST
jgi:hypothetical protein